MYGAPIISEMYRSCHFHGMRTSVKVLRTKIREGQKEQIIPKPLQA